MGTDTDYGNDMRFVLGVGLNPETANELYRLRESLRPSAGPNQQSVLPSPILESAKAAALALLGQEAFQRYTNQREGKWLTAPSQQSFR